MRRWKSLSVDVMKIFRSAKFNVLLAGTPQNAGQAELPPRKGYPRREAGTPQRGVAVGEVVAEVVVVVVEVAKQNRVAADESE